MLNRIEVMAPPNSAPPKDAGQHHDGRGRVHREGQRLQDRHAIGAAEAGQHADENAEHQHGCSSG